MGSRRSSPRQSRHGQGYGADTEENFYRTSHKKIYYAMLGLSELGEVIDQITLTEYFKVKGEMETIGGSAYLAELVQAVPTSAKLGITVGSCGTRRYSVN